MIGRTVGAYRVVERLGEGGMGEVYRARDAALGRDVAIKVLPAELADDEDRRARLNREARVLATLNHPHIAQIYGLEQADAGPVLVMELVEGVTLETYIARGAPVADALSIARQIADALDAAHARDLVHRDLKPANIKITPDGRVKVLDFGLARAVASASAETDPAAADEQPTVTSANLTTVGKILGTVTYMSPEQARGRAVDRRTDIWSFGCVLFQLYAGRPPFSGATSSDLIAAILGREPDWTALATTTPPRVRRLLRWCLQKDPRDRLRDIGDARHLLSDDADDLDGADGQAATNRFGRRLVWTLAALALGFAVSTAWLLTQGRGDAADGAPAMTFEIPPPPDTWFGSSGIEATTLALSPDGATLAFLAVSRDESRTTRIWLRDLRRGRAEALVGTEGASSMFWSPDSRTIGFFADGKLKRIDATGGTAVQVADVPVGAGLSGTWNGDGDILFSSVQGDGIFRVAAAGGQPAVQVEPGDRLRQRVLWPRFLPDGRRFLYSTLGADSQGEIVLGDLDGVSVVLLPARSHALWVEPDWLMFVREGALVAQRVDLDAGRTVGDAIPIAGPINYTTATGWSDVSATYDGLLAFRAAADVSHIAWFDGAGREISRIGAPARHLALRLSPDAATLLFSRIRPELGTYDLWTTDLARGVETRVTSSPGMETGETWLPDGRGILYASANGAAPNIHRQILDGGAPQPLLSSPRFHFPNDVSPDGGFLLFQQRTELGNWDLELMPLDDPAAVAPFIATTFSEFNARFSPLGNAVAYMSDESGGPQVHIAQFPTGPRLQVTADGGVSPRWRRDGRELYYLWRGRLMAVPMDATGRPGTPRALFDAPSWADFDVARDDRFVAVVADSLARDQPLTVIVNWPRLVAR